MENLVSSLNRLPSINAGYATPGSDYMSAVRQRQPKTPLTSSPDKSQRSHDNVSSVNRKFEFDDNGDDVTLLRWKSKGCGCSKEHDIFNKPKETTETDDRLKYARKSIVREITIPTNNRKVSNVTSKSLSDVGRFYTISPLKLSSSNSASSKRRLSMKSIPDMPIDKSWNPPKISEEPYQEIRKSLMEGGGKFRKHMRKYFHEDPPWWDQVPDSDDDGYDTDLDKQLGLELIADEKLREVLEDGVFPEYKQECRRYKSNPNSYFLRHCLDDDVTMKYRYLSKSDARTLSNLVKNHLTLASLDLGDNGLGARGMQYFCETLKRKQASHGPGQFDSISSSFPETILARQGQKHLRSALINNCYLVKLDVSENNFGEKGGKYCAGIIEDNVSIKELNISGNYIGDTAAIAIGKALGNNISLRSLDISWNNIREKGAICLANGLKKNTELLIFLAGNNGFGDEGGRALIQAIKQNSVVQEVGLDACRLNDKTLKLLGQSLGSLANLRKLHIGNNSFTPTQASQFLTSLLNNPGSLVYVNIQGVPATDQLKAAAASLLTVHNLLVNFDDPPARREVTRDVLTRNLVQIVELMEKFGITVEDLFPAYEEEDEDGQLMITMEEVFVAMECCGLISKFDKLQKLRARLQQGKGRRFSIQEFSQVYESVCSGQDTLRAAPLRTHLRRSLKEEREEKERRLRQSQQRRRMTTVVPAAPEEE